MHVFESYHLRFRLFLGRSMQQHTFFPLFLIVLVDLLFGSIVQQSMDQNDGVEL